MIAVVTTGQAVAVTVIVAVTFFIMGGLILSLSDETKEEADAEREFWRDEINAVIMLEVEGVRCPSTFDGGEYLRHCIDMYRAARA